MIRIQEFFTLHNQSDVITVVFGATTGLLTLVGLISIFVSINRQHKVEKARELYWDLASLPYQYSDYKDDKIGKKIYHIFSLYETIIKPTGDFTAKVIIMAKGSIIFVSLAWTSMLLFLMPTLYLFEYVYVIIIIVAVVFFFFAFYIFLDKLLHINSLANLPITEQLLDADNKNYDVQVISLAGIAMKLKIVIMDDIYRVSVGFPVPFVEFFIKPIITGRRIGQKKDDLPEIIKLDNDIYRVSKKYYRWWLTSPLHWFDVCEFKMPDYIENISIQMELNCSKGIVHVSYYNISAIKLKELGPIVAAQAVCPQAAQNSCPSILLIKYVQHGTAEHGDSAPIPPRFNAFVLHKGNIKGRKQGGIIPPMLPLAEPRRALGLLLSIALSSRRVRALNFLATS